MNNSAYLRSARAAHTRALAAPMSRIFMVSDPALDRLVNAAPGDEVATARATFEKRACVYACFLARQDGYVGDDAPALAQFDGKDTVLFKSISGEWFTITIPDRIMSFDPDAPILSAEEVPLQQEELML